MEQKVSYKTVVVDGKATEQEITLTVKDIKGYFNVTLALEDAMELNRLLDNKLGEIPV